MQPTVIHRCVRTESYNHASAVALSPQPDLASGTHMQYVHINHATLTFGRLCLEVLWPIFAKPMPHKAKDSMRT